MSVSITLDHKIVRTENGTVRLELTTTAFGMSSKVFAIEVFPCSADNEAPYYRFSHVCSPAELVEFPADNPGDNCYFRTNEIALIFDTDKMIAHVMKNMRADIARLVSEYNDLDASNADTVTGRDVF